MPHQPATTLPSQCTDHASSACPLPPPSCLTYPNPRHAHAHTAFSPYPSLFCCRSRAPPHLTPIHPLACPPAHCTISQHPHWRRVPPRFYTLPCRITHPQARCTNLAFPSAPAALLTLAPPPHPGTQVHPPNVCQPSRCTQRRSTILTRYPSPVHHHIPPSAPVP